MQAISISFDKKGLPLWMAPLMCALFAVLWGVWILPHTVFIRHGVMVLGSLIGLYSIIFYWRYFFSIKAFPVWCIFMLLVWVSFHLLFIGQVHEIQLREYKKVWIKVIWTAPFAVGLGFGLAHLIKSPKVLNLCWKILYIGFCLPTLIYFVKFLLTFKVGGFDITNPYLLLDSNHLGSAFGISRALYTFFCISGFALSVFVLGYENFKRRQWFSFIYPLITILTPALFFIEGDRFGLLITGLILVTAIFYFLRNFNLENSFYRSIVLLFFTLCSIMIVTAFLNKFNKWPSLGSNIEAALQLDKHDDWKFQGAKGYPLNSKNEIVDISTYERISWALAGAQLLMKHPSGVGLLSLSFDYLSKQEWPESHLSMTHSGLLDFSLGYGVIGGLLLLAAAIVSILNAALLPMPWRLFALFSFVPILFALMAKELSNEACISAFIFLILMLNCFVVGVYEFNKKQANDEYPL